jgi:hypothetical protein
MDDNRWYTQTALVIAGVFVIAILTGLALGGAFSGTSPSTGAPVPSAPTYLYFTVTTSAATQYDTYYPANVSVPHGVPVIITITCYDNGSNPPPTALDSVIGTAGGTANFSFPNGSIQQLSSLPASEISHTFTVTLPGVAGQLLLGAGDPAVNVPVPASSNGIAPAIVTFEVTFPNAGSRFVWRCDAPCDPYSMITPGFMIGAIYVT